MTHIDNISTGQGRPDGRVGVMHGAIIAPGIAFNVRRDHLLEAV